MIDTITLTSKGNIAEVTKMAEQYHTTYHHQNGNSQYNYYKYIKQDDKYAPVVSYTEESNNIKMTIKSVSQFIYGTSLKRMIDKDISLFTDKVEDYLTYELSATSLPCILEWEVSHVDIYYDFQVGEDKVWYYLQALRQKKINKYKTSGFEGETVYWISKTKTIRVYDKYKACIDKSSSKEDIEQSKGLLRLEARISKKELIKEFGSANLGDFLSQENINRLLNKHLVLIGIKDLQIPTESLVIDKLIEAYGCVTAFSIIGYLRSIKHGNDIYISISTKYKYLKLLKDIGYTSILGHICLPPLIIN